MDIAEHVEEITVIDDSPNNPNCSSSNMAQDTDECAPVSSTSSLKRTTTIDTAHHTNEYISLVSSSYLRRTSSSEFDQLELYKAVLNGHWESASQLLKNNPRLFSARFGTDESRILHIAVELGEARMGFVEKLVKRMPSEALDLKDSDGATALFSAARAGNIKAVKLLVNKNPSLPNICQRDNFAPLHSAVRYGHKELTLYLLSVTRDDEHPYPFSNSPGIELLRRALMVGFHDVALYLVKRYPDLATCNFGDAEESDDDKAPLTVLAKRPWAFRSGSCFNLCQLMIYHCIHSWEDIMKNKKKGERNNNILGF